MDRELFRRIRDKDLLKLVTEPESVIPMLTNASGRILNIGWSGFTPVGYPKVIPRMLADYVEDNSLQGKLKFNLFVGASTGAECEDRWAKLGMINRRWPYQTGKYLNEGINSGEIRMGDKHLSMFAQELFYGFFTLDNGGKLDYAIVEASAVTENGDIILTGSVGATPEIVSVAERIIVEINTALPSFEGMHDIVVSDLPPNKKVIPITKPQDRVGTTYVPVDKSKIVAIVESKYKDSGRALKEIDDISLSIADHMVDFFKNEVKSGRLPENLLPLQSGVGSIANAVVGGFVNSPFKNLTVYTEVLQDTFLRFLDSGKCDFISCSSLSLSEEGFEKWWGNYDFYKKKVVLRPQQISNHPEVIRRLGVIAMNTPVELDIYAHANSTLINGSRMINGIGGSNDFLRNGYLAVMHTPSVRKSKTDPLGISCIVPKVTHVDHTEHDLDIIVTEQGLADLRGLSPKDRARVVIENCAHPAYKDYLFDYLGRAEKATGFAHQPHILSEVYKMHINLMDSGTMRFWN